MRQVPRADQAGQAIDVSREVGCELCVISGAHFVVFASAKFFSREAKFDL
jgi:hypothetical protein